VRRVIAEIEHVAGAHHDLVLDRPHLRGVQIGEVHAARRLPAVKPPALLAGHVDDEDVVGVDVPAVGLVSALREEGRRVGERRGAPAVERRRERVDLGLENVEPLQHARGAALEMLLQHAPVDEADLALLHELVETRRRQVDRLARLEEIHVVQVEQRIVQVTAQMREREELLGGHQVRAMDVRDVGWRTEPFLEVEVANAALDGSEFHEGGPGDCGTEGPIVTSRRVPPAFPVNSDPSLPMRTAARGAQQKRRRSAANSAQRCCYRYRFSAPSMPKKSCPPGRAAACSM